jgi:hypothetical protein
MSKVRYEYLLFQKDAWDVNTLDILTEDLLSAEDRFADEVNVSDIDFDTSTISIWDLIEQECLDLLRNALTNSPLNYR